MTDPAGSLSTTVDEAHLSLDEIADAARAMLHAQTQIDRRTALWRFDGARARLDARLAALRGDLVRLYARASNGSSDPSV